MVGESPRVPAFMTCFSEFSFSKQSSVIEPARLRKRRNTSESPERFLELDHGRNTMQELLFGKRKGSPALGRQAQPDLVALLTLPSRF